MPNTFRDTVRLADGSHKFGGSRRAAIAWLASLDGCFDDASGDSSSGYAWFARLGRRVVLEDSQGFVGCQTCKSEADAIRYFDTLCANYHSGEAS